MTQDKGSEMEGWEIEVHARPTAHMISEKALGDTASLRDTFHLN